MASQREGALGWVEGAPEEELFGPNRGWQVPEENGRLLVEPSGEALVQSVARHAGHVAGLALTVGGRPLSGLRAEARGLAVREGLEFARRFELACRVPEPPRYLVVTGHQPELAHPGVWVKNALVESLARSLEGACGINVVVDYDTAAPFGAPVPTSDGAGGVRRDFVELVPVRYGQPFCEVPAPGRDALQRFASGVGLRLAGLPGPAGELQSRFAAFLEVAGAVGERASHLAEWVTAARHRYEERTLPRPPAYLEVPMERLAGSEAFLRLFAQMALDARTVAQLYNAVLARYRRWRRIRSRANPFPDLRIEPERVELPFWVLTPGSRRRALYGRQSSSGLELLTADGPLATFPLPDPEAPDGTGFSRLCDALVERVRTLGLQVRPRAVTLTLFLRLFVADLFVHGVGGARYDRVTDALMRAYFGLEPPPYAVASMSLPLPLPWPPEAVERAQLRHRLSELRHNPQRHLPALDSRPLSPDERQRAARLATEKLALIRAIQQPEAPRRALTRRIEAVNGALRTLLAPVVEETEARLQRALRAETARQTAVFRGYPFFFHSAERVWRAALEALDGDRLGSPRGLPRERR